jgi:hypothetical protein
MKEIRYMEKMKKKPYEYHLILNPYQIPAHNIESRQIIKLPPFGQI